MANLDFLNDGVIGRHFSMSKEIAESFSNNGSNYDERFINVHGTNSIRVLCEFEAIGNPDLIKIAPTVAMNIAGGEDEVILKDGSPITLRRLWVNGKSVNHAMIGKVLKV